MKDNYVQTCVSLMNASPDNKFYSFKSECACFSHDLEIHLESDGSGEGKLIQMTMYDQVYIGEDLNDSNVFKKLLFRIKNAWKCLFGDGFEIEHSFVFKGEEHLKQFQTYFNDRCGEIFKQNSIKRKSKKYYYRPKNNKKNKETQK